MNSNNTNQGLNYITMSSRIVSMHIHYNFRIFINIFGIVSNIISLLIFTRPNLNKKTNTGFLYSILCVLNIVTFIDNGHETFSSKFPALMVILPSRLKFFISASLVDSLLWMEILISFDRFFILVYPAKAKIMTKKVFFKYSNDSNIIILIIF